MTGKAGPIIAIMTLSAALAGCVGDGNEWTGSDANSIDEGNQSTSESVNAADVTEPAPDRPSQTKTGDYLGIHRMDWFEAEPTGNCCENYLITTPTGRILDFGGTFIKYSDNEGQSWITVDNTETPVLSGSGEGAVALAPNGDIVGIGWAPYSGDQVYSFKYTATTGKWSSAPVPIHPPAWDRQWIVALPGPFTINGQTVDYVTFARGGSGYKEVLLMSTDGLNYNSVSWSEAGANIETVQMPALSKTSDPIRDWIQPLQYTRLMTIGDGMALHQLYGPAGCLRIFTANGNWACLELTEATIPDGALMMDSAGSLHVVDFVRERDAFIYSISHNGGRTWTERQYGLPDGYTMVEWDFKPHRALDQTVVALRGEDENDQGQDMVFRFRGLADVPWLEVILLIGDGKSVSGTGGASNQESERYDFMSTGFLPDGRILISMMDSDTPDPVIAIEP